MQRIRLASWNPHPSKKADPRSMAVRRLLGRWWGKTIWVSDPRPPNGRTICDTPLVWQIVGPSELVAALEFHGLNPVTCIHCLEVDMYLKEATDERIAV